MLTGNVGEWSEIYTFLKLLADGKLYAADTELNKIEDIYYPILSILRNESDGTLDYKRNGNIKIFKETDEELISEIPITEFNEEAIKLFQKIKTDGNSHGSFTYPELEGFLQRIYVTKLKANSKRKEDINLIVHDFRTGLNPKLGFSIKSQLGGASTLLNPGTATNFTYIVSSSSSSLREGISEYGDERQRLRDRIKEKIENGFKFEYQETGNATFTSNLMMIDSLLPEVVSSMVLAYYRGEATTIKDLVEVLKSENPLNFDLTTHNYYEHKIKNFLMDIALGMTPATTWTGNYIATGGYIIVRSDGEIVCYHIYNTNEFKEYLFNNTKLDSPSTARYGYGNFYQENDCTKIKLNLQIRFTR